MSAEDIFEKRKNEIIQLADDKTLKYINEIRAEIVVLLLQKLGCGGKNDLGRDFCLSLDDIAMAEQYTVAVKQKNENLCFRIFKKKSH